MIAPWSFLLLLIVVQSVEAFTFTASHINKQVFNAIEAQTLQSRIYRTCLFVAHEKIDGMEECDSINISKLVEEVVSEATLLSSESDSVAEDGQISVDQRMMQEAIKAASWYGCL
jgi:hypothetical protein